MRLALASLFGLVMANGQVLTVVNSASYQGVPADATCCAYVAPGSLVSMFGANLAIAVFTSSDSSPSPQVSSLGGVSATVTDVNGTYPVSLIAVTSNQVNAVLPSELQSGFESASVSLTTSSGAQLSTKISINAAFPAFFTADQTGNWLPAARVVTAHATGTQTVMDSVANCGTSLVWNGNTWSPCVPIPINLGGPTDQTVLELFGTGIRGSLAIAQQAASMYGSQIAPVYAYVGSLPDNANPNPQELTVLYAGTQGAGAIGSFYGLDQVNILLPNFLAGSGMISIAVQVASGFIDGEPVGQSANAIYIDIQ